MTGTSGIRPILGGGALGLVAWAILRVEESGAVPADEFPPAVATYLAAPWVAVAGVMLLVWGIWRLLRTRRQTPPHTATGDAFTLNAAGAARAGVALCGSITAATLVLALSESALFTARFVPDLVTGDQLLGYQAGLGSLALAIGVQSTLVCLGALALLTLLLRLAPGRERACCALACAVGVTLTLLALLRLTLNSELLELRLWPLVIAAATCVGGLVGCGLIARLNTPPAHPGADLADTLASLPARLLGGTPRLVMASVVFLSALAPALYPDVEDFRMQLFPSIALAAIFVFSAMLIAIGRAARRPRATRLAAIACLAVSTLTLITNTQRPDTAFVAHEYARFGNLVTDIPAARWLHPFEEIGFDNPHTTPWPHHPPGAAQLPALPGSVIATQGLPPIIIVLWDAARPDRCSAFGHGRPTTPNLKRLADRSLAFSRAYSSATATTAAVKGLLSGCYSTRHMLAESHPPFVTMDLAAIGYEHFIVTVTGNDYNGVSAEAFRRGWTHPGITWEDITLPNVDGPQLDGEKTAAVVAALERRAARTGSVDGTFAYLHLTGPHIPWTGDDAPIEFGDLPTDRYDEEMAKADARLGELLDALERLRILDRAIVVVTADHGTALGEHGKLAGYLLYEEQIRVPLVMHLPGVAPRRIADPVASIDVAPTLMNLFRPGQPHRHHGRSLIPLATGRPLPPRPFVSFCAFWDSYAVLDSAFRWKLHHHRGRRYEALFDLDADPRERTNLITEQPDIADRLRTMLDGFLWEGRHSYGNPYHYRAWAGPGG
ncbi:MAG: sulfatase [Planctomycetota bacterium]|nr:sulfatase [Planctomycetota bacterium]